MWSKYLKCCLVLFVLACFSSCLDVGGDDDDDDATPGEPLISLQVNGGDPDDFTADVGDTILITGSANAEGIIDEFKGSVSYGDTTFNLILFEGDSSSTEFVVDPIEYVVGFETSGQSLLFTFVLFDMQEMTDAEVFQVQINESPLTAVDEIILGGYNHATYGNLLNIQSDTVYFPNNVRVNEMNREGVDLIASFDAEVGWSLSSPDHPEAEPVWNDELTFNWPFIAENNTRLMMLSENFDYELIRTSAQLDDVFTTSGTSSISAIEEGQVIAFRIDPDKGSKVGILQVKAISGFQSSNRQLILAYKIQN